MTRLSSFCALGAPFVLVLSLSVPDAALAQPAPPPQPSAQPAQPNAQPALPAQPAAPPAGPAAPAAPGPAAPAPVPSAAAPSADFTQPLPYTPSLPRAAAVDEDDEVESAAPRRKRRKALSESRPARLQWQPGEAIPPGYRVVDGPDKRFVIGGITTFGAMYVSSIIGGLIGITVNAGDELSPLFVPLAGPFITVATSNADRASAYVLALDGIGQIAGGAFFMVGFLKRDRWLQRDEMAPPQLSIGPRGASLRMEF